MNLNIIKIQIAFGLVSCRDFIMVLIAFSSLIVQTGCKKLVEANPPVTSISEESAYATDVAATSVLTGLYYRMIADPLVSGNNSISLMAGLSADEFTLSSIISNTDAKYFHYVDSLFSNPTGSPGAQYWSPFYTYIFTCNSVIENLNRSQSISSVVKKQLLGEAYFMRAFFYFYLTNLHGDVPLVTGTEWKRNIQLTRKSKAEVCQHIIADLKVAQEMLSEKYLDGNLQPYSNVIHRVRPTKWAATALLARVYLFNGEWINAEAQATLVINNNALYNIVGLQEVFKKNNSEAIWQLQPIGSGQNTSDAVLFIIPATGPNSLCPVYFSPQLLGSFEANDKRRYNQTWVDSVKISSDTYYYPYKYKEGKNSGITSISQLTEYLMVLRLAEQYLIRAESRAHLNNISGSQFDLNVIRTRAGLSNTTASTQPSLLSAILHERQVEFFSEWGHRWLDLKRTGNLDAVMSLVRPLKANGAPWKPYMQLYPIPFDDIQKNGNLVQNPGYF